MMGSTRVFANASHLYNYLLKACLTPANEYWQFTDYSVSLDINF